MLDKSQYGLCTECMSDFVHPPREPGVDATETLKRWQSLYHEQAYQQATKLECDECVALAMNRGLMEQGDDGRIREVKQ